MQTSKEQKLHHSVYVVLLDNAVAKHSSILRVNPAIKTAFSEFHRMQRALLGNEQGKAESEHSKQSSR